jgi:hypothetical protein
MTSKDAAAGDSLGIPSPANAEASQRSTPKELDFARLRARAAVTNVMLYSAEDDQGDRVFVVSRWGLSRQLDSLQAASDWLDRVTGARS